MTDASRKKIRIFPEILLYLSYQNFRKEKRYGRQLVEEKIQKGFYEHDIEEIGTPGRPFIIKYRLDLAVKVVATEVRNYADDMGKFQIPPELKGEVTYGGGIKAIAAFPYSEGVVSNDRICAFLNSLSGDSLDISEGSVYHFCRSFSRQ